MDNILEDSDQPIPDRKPDQISMNKNNNKKTWILPF